MTELINPGKLSSDLAAQDFARTWNQLILDERTAMADWITRLREQKVVAAMADDGRVDRLHSLMRLSNPDFNDGTYFGAVVALGTTKEHRLVQIIKPVPTPLGLGPQTTYEFAPYDPNKVYYTIRGCDDEGYDVWKYVIADKTPTPAHDQA